MNNVRFPSLWAKMLIGGLFLLLPAPGVAGTPDISLLVETVNRLATPHKEAYLAQDSLVSLNITDMSERLKKRIQASERALAAEYERRMVFLSETTKNADSLLTTCLGALATDIASLQPMACEGIVQVMAVKENASLLEAAIRRLERVVPPEDAEAFRKDYEDILHPMSFADQVRGTWVSADYLSTIHNHFPYFMIHIHSLADNGIQLLNIPGETTRLESKDILSLCQSQYLGGTDGHIIASFGSEKMERGHSDFAKQGFETTRELRATNRATIASSPAPFKQKLGATITTEIVSGLLDQFFKSTAQSHKHVAALTIDMTQLSSVAMTTNTRYYNYTVSTSDIGFTPTPLKQDGMMLVKWEAEDGVFFVDSKNQVFSVTPQEQLDLTEYNSIMAKYSGKRSKYLLPTLAAIGGGAAMMTGGIMMGVNSVKKDKYGNKLYNSEGMVRLNTGKLVGGILLAVCGEITALAIPLNISVKRLASRNKEITRLNEQQASRLSRKGTLSITPEVNPEEISIGLYTAFTF